MGLLAEILEAKTSLYSAKLISRVEFVINVESSSPCTTSINGSKTGMQVPNKVFHYGQFTVQMGAVLCSYNSIFYTTDAG